MRRRLQLLGERARLGALWAAPSRPRFEVREDNNSWVHSRSGSARGRAERQPGRLRSPFPFASFRLSGGHSCLPLAVDG
jgi:hypothetical protein